MSTIFITGIDTDSGKSYATGMFWRYLKQNGEHAITQKLIQTGCHDPIAEDIITHRSFINGTLLPEDLNGLTSPQIFKFPASPHLAASLENSTVDINTIDNATAKLTEQFEYVLIEGAGGLNVPLQRDLLTADWLEARRYPTIVVSSGRLGSINHTLLTLEVAARRNIPVIGIIYNLHPAADPQITADSKTLFIEYLKKFNFPPALVELPFIKNPAQAPDIDFSILKNYPLLTKP
ncbi:MAG: dethiobiotin synthase [Victivallaceae bacterium]|nr:dethiobiotin synthase [Victivallaceae bacterium]